MNDFDNAIAEWPVNFSSQVVESAFGYSLCGFTIALEAWRRGHKVTLLKDGASQFKRFVVEGNGKALEFNKSRVGLVSKNAIDATVDKSKTKLYLEERGVPYPKGRKFNEISSLDDICSYANAIGYPVVIKPASGSLGVGVYSNIKSESQLRLFYSYLSKEVSSKNIIIEKFAKGEDYRVFVVGGKSRAAVKRVPANIVGDGKSTVKKLVINKNKEKSQNPFLSKGLIKIDSEVLDKLKSEGLKPSSVVSKGKLVQLREKANASAGGDTIDVTDILPGFVMRAAEEAVESIPGLLQGGVDIIFDSDTEEFSIIEINSRAQIGVNMYPSYGVGKDLPKDIIDTYFGEGGYVNASLGKMLFFDYSSARNILVNGVADSLCFSSIPSQLDKAVQYSVDWNSVKNKRLFSRRVRRMALREGVIGHIEVKGGGADMLVVGSVAAVEKIENYLRGKATVNQAQKVVVDTPVKAGFFI
jgi:D-alanine-D-alanine ligase-like ATP-grasp enzyme